MVMDLEQSKELKKFQVDQNIREEEAKHNLALKLEQAKHRMRMEELQKIVECDSEIRKG